MFCPSNFWDCSCWSRISLLAQSLMVWRLFIRLCLRCCFSSCRITKNDQTYTRWIHQKINSPDNLGRFFSRWHLYNHSFLCFLGHSTKWGIQCCFGWLDSSDDNFRNCSWNNDRDCSYLLLQKDKFSISNQCLGILWHITFAFRNGGTSKTIFRYFFPSSYHGHGNGGSL